MSDNDKNRPAIKHRDGPIEVAVWRRETDTGPVFNTERTRSYQDQAGNWQKTHSIPERDLLRAAHLDQKAYESIQSMREQDRAAYIGRQSDPRKDQDAKRER